LAFEVVGADNAGNADAAASEGNDQAWMNETAEAPRRVLDENWGESMGESSSAALASMKTSSTSMRRRRDRSETSSS